jgi:Na+/H+-dicarboxylate symporter
VFSIFFGVALASLGEKGKLAGRGASSSSPT